MQALSQLSYGPLLEAAKITSDPLFRQAFVTFFFKLFSLDEE
jgi:hypothetical protein